MFLLLRGVSRALWVRNGALSQSSVGLVERRTAPARSPPDATADHGHPGAPGAQPEPRRQRVELLVAVSVTQSGLLIAPAAFVQLLVGPVVGSLGTRFGFRSMLALGGAFVALSFVVLSV